MAKYETFVHPSAVVHPKAQLDTGVRVGPFVFIGGKVSIHRNTVIDAHVFIDGLTEIGEDCRFSPFSSVLFMFITF